MHRLPTPRRRRAVAAFAAIAEEHFRMDLHRPLLPGDGRWLPGMYGTADLERRVAELSGPPKPREVRAPGRSAGGRLVVISGPSGLGKDTVVRELLRIDPRLCCSVSYTTRAPRPGEIEGVAYSFVDEPAFLAAVQRGEFLEWARVHGNLYGTALARVRPWLICGHDVVMKVDVQGAAQVRGRLPEAISIFLLPSSQEELRRRLSSRGTEDAQSLAAREADAAREIAEGSHFDHRVVNLDARGAAREIARGLRDDGWRTA